MTWLLQFVKYDNWIGVASETEWTADESVCMIILWNGIDFCWFEKDRLLDAIQYKHLFQMYEKMRSLLFVYNLNVVTTNIFVILIVLLQQFFFFFFQGAGPKNPLWNNGADFFEQKELFKCQCSFSPFTYFENMGTLPCTTHLLRFFKSLIGIRLTN